MGLPARPIEITPVAQGMLLDGRSFVLNHVKYSAPLLGQGDSSFALDIKGNATTPDEVHGFTSQEEAVRFLTTFDEREYAGFDNAGNPVTQKRVGLGLPDGLIRVLKDDVKTVSPTGVVEPVSNPATDPVSDEQKLAETHGRTAGTFNQSHPAFSPTGPTGRSGVTGGPAKNN
jgi:hypothetical protein